MSDNPSTHEDQPVAATAPATSIASEHITDKIQTPVDSDSDLPRRRTVSQANLDGDCDGDDPTKPEPIPEDATTTSTSSL